MNKLVIVLSAVLIALGSSGAFAHGDKPAHHAAVTKKEQKEWGIAGDAKAVVRTIHVRMSDDMRFIPDKISVRQGDTIRIVLKNTGAVMHELVIGTQKELAEHAAMMVKFPNMEHDEPYMAHVAHGKTGSIVWTFNKPGDFEFACLIPGHFQAGMFGKIKVTASGRSNGPSNNKR